MNEKLLRALEKIKETNKPTTSIGTEHEKTLHKTIKYYLSLDENTHEQRIDKNIIDVYMNNNIYEIQTQGFDKLRQKLTNLLPNHDVTIVYPIPYIKYIHLINEYGEVISERKSPKKGNPQTIFVELYKIKNYLLDSHLHLLIIMINTDEFRDVKERKHFGQKGYSRNDQFVLDIVKEININTINDYKKFIEDLPKEKFTSEDVKKFYGISKKNSCLLVNILCYLSIIEKCGVQNRFYLYQKVQ